MLLFDTELDVLGRDLARKRNKRIQAEEEEEEEVRLPLLTGHLILYLDSYENVTENECFHMLYVECKFNI